MGEETTCRFAQASGWGMAVLSPIAVFPTQIGESEETHFQSSFAIVCVPDRSTPLPNLCAPVLPDVFRDGMANCLGVTFPMHLEKSLLPMRVTDLQSIERPVAPLARTESQQGECTDSNSEPARNGDQL